jgi:hypothetical protein
LWQGICNHELFIETACFVLFLAMLHEERFDSSHSRYIMRAIKCLHQMPYKRRLVELISALEELMTRVELLTGQRARNGLVLGQMNATSVPSAEQVNFEACARETQSTDAFGSESRPFESSTSLHEDPDTGLDHDEQMLLPMELMPDTAWPSMEWNLNLLQLDTDFLNSYIT